MLKNIWKFFYLHTFKIYSFQVSFKKNLNSQIFVFITNIFEGYAFINFNLIRFNNMNPRNPSERSKWGRWRSKKSQRPKGEPYPDRLSRQGCDHRHHVVQNQAWVRIEGTKQLHQWQGTKTSRTTTRFQLLSDGDGGHAPRYDLGTPLPNLRWVSATDQTFCNWY